MSNQEKIKNAYVGFSGLKAISSAAPWLIIGGLLWAGLFVKPTPTGNTVQPPVLEHRDQFYGAAWYDPKTLWLAGGGGKIVVLSDSGQPTRQITPTDKALQDIALWDSERAVAVGNDGIVLVTTNGGKAWETIEAVPRSDVANKLNRVHAAPGGKAVAVGEMGAVLFTDNFGSNWKRLRPEEDLAWNDVAILPSGKLVLVGEFGHVALSQDGGSNWTDIKAPVGQSLMALSFRDELNGIAVGLDGIVLMTGDGGRNWKSIDVNLRDHLYDIAWSPNGKHWVGTGSLGRWLQIDTNGIPNTGRLDERDLSWHVRAVPNGNDVWFVGANVGRWSANAWHPLGESWQPSTLMGLPVNSEKKDD